MRQVPVSTSFLIIGNGRVARHIRHYFSLENIPYQSWHRQQDAGELDAKAQKATHILLLISDRAITAFYDEHPELHDKTCLHFSGALVSDKILGAHPLMTFSEELYDLETYRNIPFVIERGGLAFHQLLPGLKNRSYEIEPSQKGLYHALCSLAGNFTVMLWEKAFSDFSSKLGLPQEILTPYLSRITENLANAPKGTSVLTGPLVRRDQTTVDKHLHQLENDPYQDVYAAFVAAYSSSLEQGAAT